MVDIKELVKNGVHFGHQTSRWCPLMAPYIWGHRRGVHLIDVSKTAINLEKAASFLNETAAQGKTILWVGTKKPAQAVVEQLGARLDAPHVVHRWVGGTITNHSQVKKAVTKLLHYEDVLAKSEDFHYIKKELNTFQKILGRLKETVGGIVSLSWPIGAIVLVDVKKEQTALREAVVAGIPVVALVDTNSDPSMVDYVIPCNDDSPKSISIILDYLAASVEKGKKVAAQRKKDEIEAAKAAKAAKIAEKEKAAKEKVAAKKEEKPKTEPKKEAVAKKPAAKPVAKKVAAKK